MPESHRPTVSSTPASRARKPADATELPAETRVKILKAMLAARLSDEAEFGLKRRGTGQFQLSSAGHEALAAVAFALRPEDWIHPHYRDRALMLARGFTHEDLALDYLAKRTAFSGGRQMPYHYSSPRLRVVTMSSPVGTNFLQAVGMAQSLKAKGAADVVVALGGDAGSREGEVMEALMEAAVENLPVVFVIEDNGYGISTPTDGKTFWSLPSGLPRDKDGTARCLGCRVEVLDGLDPLAVYQAAAASAERARSGGGPTCLVAELERLASHSCSDDHRIYRGEGELAAVLARDPLKLYKERCLAEGIVTAEQVAKMESAIRAEIEAALAHAQSAPEPDPEAERDGVFAPLPPGMPEREAHLPAARPKSQGGVTLAQCLTRVLEDELRRNPWLTLLGEDLEDPKGDVFGVTRGLSTAFPGRVRNSPLAEATIMGVSIGRALLGDVSVAAIQFVDFIGPALNQLFNEAVTLHWRSRGDWNCPLVILSPCGGYLPGTGPWHSQSNEALFAHVPGLHVVCPSNPGDAAGLLRYALRCGRPVLFLYPKALLHGADDTVEAPDAECIVPFGRARVARAGRDVTVVAWGNAVPLCLQASRRAADEDVQAEVLDLRTLVPWDTRAVLESVRRTGRLLVVHEDNRTCGLGGEIVAEVCEQAFERLVAPPRRLARPDTPIPYHFGLELALLPSVDDVLQALRELSRPWTRAAVETAPAEPPSPVAAPIPTTPARAIAPPRPPSPPAPRRLAVVVPKQSPTDEDATVIRFHVQVGQEVQAGTLLVEMEANKGSFEIDSPHPGRVAEVRAKEGERVRIGSTLLYIEVPEGLVLEDVERSGEPTAVESAKEIRLSPAQLQVGALGVKSLHEIPTVSVETDIDLTDLAVERDALRQTFVAKWGAHVSYTHLILWAIIQALKEDRNEGFRGRLDANAERLLISPHVNVGLAVVGRNEDLYSPVVKAAERMSLKDVVLRVQTLTEAVRLGNVNVSDLQGATVTLTNIGPLMATRGTPFVLPGQVAMVAAGSLRERPRYVAPAKDQVPTLQCRKVLALRLVFDHRPFNGTHAMAFVNSIKAHLEQLVLKDHV